MRADCLRRGLCLVMLCLTLGRGAAFGQMAPRAATEAGPASALRIYLDCWQCDTDYLRQHVLFIEYVRDRATADRLGLVGDHEL